MVPEAASGQVRTRRSAVRYYNVRVYIVGQALSNIGSFSQIVALSLLVLDLTGSGVALGAVMAAQSLPMLLLAAPAGSVLDRIQLRRLLLVTALAGAAQAACLTALVFTGGISLAWVFGLAVALGCIQVFDRPAAQTFIRELVPTESIPSAVSLLSATQSIGRLAGPSVAAVLYALSGPASVFAINALSFAAVVAALLLLRGSELFPRLRHSGKSTGVATALRFALRSPSLRSVLLGNAVVGLLAFNFPTFLASLSSLTFHQPELFGIAESVNAVTALITAFVMARYLHRPSPRTVALGALALGSSQVWTALSPTAPIFLASMLYFGFAVICYTTSSQSFVQQASPAEMSGRMMSLYVLGGMGTTPLGALIAGLVIDNVSPRAAIGLGAASAIVIGLALLVADSTSRISRVSGSSAQACD